MNGRLFAWKETWHVRNSFNERGCGSPLKEARGWVQRSSSKPGLWTFSPSYSLEARERERLEERGCELPLLWEQSGMSNNPFLSLWPKALPPLVPLHPSTPQQQQKENSNLCQCSPWTSPTCPSVQSFLTGSPPDTTPPPTNTLLAYLQNQVSGLNV